MYEALASIVIAVLKWIANSSAKKKLNDEQFIKFIEVHQTRKVRAADSALSFEDALKKGFEELDKKNVSN